MSTGAHDVSVTADTLPEDLGSDDLVLLGWPVAHSRSPAMHDAAAAHLGLPLRYRTLAVAPEQLDDVVVALGQRGVRGANVTVPHKLAVMAHCDVLSDEARLVGAVNTLTWERSDGERDADVLRVEGHNTDALGLEAALAEDAGTLHGARVLLLGTGGAARAAAVALVRSGAIVTVAGRDPRGRAAILDVVTATDQVGGAAGGGVDLYDTAALAAAVTASRMVLNATSLGLAGEHLPAACEALQRGQVAYELVYGPETPFLAAARAAGAQAHGGLGMLVHQAAAAFARWSGVEAPTGVMRDALSK